MSIKSQIIFIIVIFSIIMSGCLGVLSYINAANAVTNEVTDAIELLAVESAKLVASQVETQLTFLETLSQNKVVLDHATTEEKLKYLTNEARRMGYQVLGIADLKGKALRSDGVSVDITDREFYTLALEGQSNVSDVLIDKTNGQPIIIFAAPIIRNDKVTGVLYGVRDANELSKLTNAITLGESGYAFMVNGEGTTIAHPDIEQVINFDNVIENAAENKELTRLADLVGKMISGETGTGTDHSSGENRMLGYAPVPGMGWSLAVSVETKEILRSLNSMKTQSILVSVALVGLGIIGALLIGRLLALPIMSLSSDLERFAEYDLRLDESSSVLKLTKRKDEIGKIAHSIAKMQAAFVDLIKQAIMSSEMVGATSEELSASIREISSNVEVQASNTEEVSSSMEEMTANINEVNSSMLSAAKDVNTISQTMAEVEETVAGNANNLDKINDSLKAIHEALDGARQSVDTITSKSKAASREASTTVALANEGKKNLDKTVTQMASIQDTILSLSGVINGLGESASQIGDITDLIKDVAEQTNLLALNASIEAARAGEHGKGFAVVAQAIGNLAEESQNATKEITKVIKNIQAEIGNAVQSSEEGTRVVENGTVLVKETSASLDKIFEAIQMTSRVIQEITEQMDIQSYEINSVYESASDINGKVGNLMSAMKEETASIAQMKEKLAAINVMINEISASLEQQSAASEEISTAINDNAAGIEQISSGGKEIARSAEELAISAQKMIEQVQRFKI